MKRRKMNAVFEDQKGVHQSCSKIFHIMRTTSVQISCAKTFATVGYQKFRPGSINSDKPRKIPYLSYVALEKLKGQEFLKFLWRISGCFQFWNHLNFWGISDQLRFCCFGLNLHFEKSKSIITNHNRRQLAEFWRFSSLTFSILTLFWWISSLTYCLVEKLLLNYFSLTCFLLQWV